MFLSKIFHVQMDNIDSIMKISKKRRCKNMKGKKITALMLTAAMAMSLTAMTGTTVNAKGETTKISFLTCQGKFKESYRDMAAAIKEDHNIEVDFQVVPDNEYYSLLQVKLSTSEVPDIFEYNFPTQNEEIGAAQYCEDLSNEEWVSRLSNPDLIKDPNDGKIYALPKESSSCFTGIYYNKEILKQAGIEEPHPATFEEVLDICEAVKTKVEGVTPIYMTNKDTWTTQIFMSCGMPVALDGQDEVFDKLLANEVKWTEIPEIKSNLDDFMKFWEGGYVNDDCLSVGYDTAAEAIGTGKAAMYISTEGFPSDMMAKYPDCEIGAFAIPYNGVEKLGIGAYVQGLFVPSEGKQVDKAKEFLKIWSDPKYQNIYYEQNPGFPAFTDVDGGAVPESTKYLVENYVDTGNYVYQLNDRMAICMPVWPDLWNYYGEMIGGTKTSEEVLETWQKQYEDFMQQQGAEGF